MRFRLLGRSGLRVSEICLGTMTFGERWGWGASREESRRIFDTFAAAGGNFVDTANNYTLGQSEEFVGECIAADRDHFVVATKYSLSTRRDDPNAGGNSRKSMVRAVESSLHRLRTDYVDLLYLHMWDDTTPLEEIARAFDDLVRAGKVLYVGFSDTPAWVVSAAVVLAEQRGWAPPVALQAPYNLVTRDAERELLPMSRAADLAFLAWAPLAAGELTGKYLVPPTGPRREAASELDARGTAIVEEVRNVADELGRPAAQVALTWLMRRPGGVTIPIVGARSVEQLRENLGCLELSLTEEQLGRLDAVSAINLGFPGRFLASPHVAALIHGDTRPLLDAHR